MKRLLIGVLAITMLLGCSKAPEETCESGCAIEDKMDQDINVDNIQLDVISFDEAYEFIQRKDTGVLMFSFTDCPWCKVILPYVEEVAENNPYIQVKYVNVARSEREKGQNTYDKLYEIFEPYLKEELGEDNEKMYVPYLVWLDNGEIVQTHTGTIDDELELNDKQIAELYKILNDGFALVGDKR